MEEKLNITEENYEGYKELSLINKGYDNSFYYHKYNKITTIIIMALSGVSTIVALTTFEPIFIITIFAIGSSAFMDRMNRKLAKRAIKRDYPYVNLKIDSEELNEEIKKYEELSKVPKNIEGEKQEHISKLSDDVKSMTTEEKIEYLKKEKEFWEKVALSEKYGIKDESIKVNEKRV